MAEVKAQRAVVTAVLRTPGLCTRAQTWPRPVMMSFPFFPSFLFSLTVTRPRALTHPRRTHNLRLLDACTYGNIGQDHAVAWNH